MDLPGKLTKVMKNTQVFHVPETVDLFAHLEKISSSALFAVNGEAEHADFIDSSVTEEEEEEIRMDPPTPPLTAPPLVPVTHRMVISCVRSSCC